MKSNYIYINDLIKCSDAFKNEFEAMFDIETLHSIIVSSNSE